jgi:cysteine desulfurase
VFTSGATEANNLALRGGAAARGAGSHVAVPATEHASILAPARALAAAGHRLTVLAVDGAGLCHPRAVGAAVPDLLSVALANAETGVVQPVAALAAPVRTRGGVVHVDAAQAAAHLAIDVDALGADLVTLSSAKVGGPPGAGALYVRRGTRLVPLHHGGPQELGLRAGTENVPAIVGFATAFAIAAAEREREHARLAALTTSLRRRLRELVPAARFAPADGVAVAPHVVNVTLPGLVGEDVVAALDLEGIAAATGSACAAGAAEPSPVLLAMGWSRTDAASALRLSFGWATAAADVDGIVAALARVLARSTAGTRREETAWPARA